MFLNFRWQGNRCFVLFTGVITTVREKVANSIRFPQIKGQSGVNCRGNIMRVVLAINFRVSKSRTAVACACRPTLAQFYLFVHIVCPVTYRHCHFIRLTTIKIKQQQLNNQIHYINLLCICKQQIPCHGNRNNIAIFLYSWRALFCIGQDRRSARS